MNFQELKRRVSALGPFAAWPAAAGLLDRPIHQEDRSLWCWPAAACEACGAAADDALDAAASIFLSVIGIHLVDDLLDEDPGGEHHALGVGRAANLGLLFQSAAHQAVAASAQPQDRQAWLHQLLAEANAGTALGQELDMADCADEAAYWAMTDAKTSPLLMGGLQMGAVSAGADAATVAGFRKLGSLLGRFIQVSDDLGDALETPAKPDWDRPRNNLALMYACDVDHPEREEFLRLRAQVASPPQLEAARRILVRCGAVAFCVERELDLARQIIDQVRTMNTISPAPLLRLIFKLSRPLRTVLAEGGFEDAAQDIFGPDANALLALEGADVAAA